MNAPRKASWLVISILFAIPLFLIFNLTDIHISSPGAYAYPAPNQPVAPVQNPYPAPNSLSPGTPEPPKALPANFLPTHYIYLPVVRKDPPARFSVAGTNDESWVLQVVPNGLQIDPYSWDRLPNNSSSIQMIRACTYYRNKTTSTIPTWHYEFSDWYWPNMVGLRMENGQYVLRKSLCWDPINQKVAQIVYQPACPYYDSALAIPTDGSPDIPVVLRNQRKPCLDTEMAAVPDTGETELRALVQNHPE